MAENIQVQDTENYYSVQKSGEEIDEILDRAGKIHYGTVEYKLTEAIAVVRIPLKFDFTPKRVIATLRMYEPPTPYQTFCTHVMEYSNSLNFVICMGGNEGSNIVKVSAGTYYVDYIAIE